MQVDATLISALGQWGGVLMALFVPILLYLLKNVRTERAEALSDREKAVEDRILMKQRMGQMDDHITTMTEGNREWRRDFKSDFEDFRKEVREGFESLRKEMKGDMIGLRKELKASMGELHTRVNDHDKEIGKLKGVHGFNGK